MLVINGGFFLAEIIVGYYAGSLALVREKKREGERKTISNGGRSNNNYYVFQVADSFHMLNDMLSLGVALWAIKVYIQREKYKYNWNLYTYSTVFYP